MKNCPICLEDRASFITTACNHGWCMECDYKYRQTLSGHTCMFCRSIFREQGPCTIEKRRTYDSYSDAELFHFFGELPNIKCRRRKYYRGLRQHFKALA